MMNKKRYFVIYFSGVDEKGLLQSGKVEYKTKNGTFVNEKSVLSVIKNKFPLEMLFIKSIMELSESDYKDWSKGRGEGGIKTIGEGTEDFL